MTLEEATAAEAEQFALAELTRLPAGVHTNYFRQPLAPADNLWVRTGESLVILTPEHGFHRLYYVTHNAADLQRLVRTVNAPGEIVVEHIHNEVEPNIAGAFLDGGYDGFAEYHRMTNRDMGSYRQHGEIGFAAEQDAGAIEQLLTSAFDARTDRLPSHSALCERIARREVIVRRLPDRLCGFVIFAVEGAVANFNYLFSNCGNRLDTSAMIETFYAVARERGARRTFLWVDSAKAGVIRLYERFGWKKDRLTASYYRRAS